MTALRQIVHSVAAEVMKHRPELTVRVQEVDGDDPPGPVATNVHVYQGETPLANVFSFEKGALEVMAPFPDGERCKYLEAPTLEALGEVLRETLREVNLLG